MHITNQTTLPIRDQGGCRAQDLRTEEKPAEIRRVRCEDLRPTKPILAATEKAGQTHRPNHHPARPKPTQPPANTRTWKEKTGRRERREPMRRRRRLPKTWEPAAPRLPSDDRSNLPTSTVEGERERGGRNRQSSKTKMFRR